jgi:predicted RND superfamily exporter protein
MDPDSLIVPKNVVMNLAPSPEEGELAWSALNDRFHERARTLAIDDAVATLRLPKETPAAALAAIRNTLSELLPAQPIGPAPRPLTTRLAGEPILDRGLSRSVAVNQERSLIVSIVLVMLLMAALFRSFYVALISMIPSMLAMAVLFGAMGLCGVRIDIGTSLVASIATGAGSDFAMHYLWYLKRSTPEDVVRFVGPIMVISAVLIAAGFAVLGAGKAQPMRMFGSLAALAMAGAALATFLLVPALLRRVDLGRSRTRKEIA